jgi:hypothetical protein
MGSNVYIEDENGRFNITGDLLTVYDDDTPTPNVRVQLGNYDVVNGKFGLLVKSADGNTTIIDESGILTSDTISRADNVDSTHKLKIKFYVDDNVISVNQVKLSFSLENFRAYSGSGTQSGGTSTTSSGGTTTTQSGGTTTTSSGGGETSDPGYWTLIPAQGLLGDFMDFAGSHNHGGAVSSDGAHVHSMYSVRHTHDVDDHTHGIPTHSHSISKHSHSISTHTHAINYSIYESGSAATNVKIYVDSILRLDNGGSGYTTSQNSLDLSSWISTSGWHTVELESSQLGRIDASIYIKSFIGT